MIEREGRNYKGENKPPYASRHACSRAEREEDKLQTALLRQFDAGDRICLLPATATDIGLHVLSAGMKYNLN